ncbi:hypothetical protein [Rossellomorea sp. RS05]|uniref:hypothetical protein n=1 Tax=Rossellomorea sp. RS05 TaxID=3149166 RepID=UPI0032214830
MPTWILIHGSLMVFWFIFWALMYYFKLWRIGFPFNKSTAFKAVFLYLFPISWLACSVILGTITSVLLDSNLWNVLLAIILPLLVLIAYSLNIFVSRYLFFRSEASNESAVNKTKEDMMKWTKQFPFIKEDNLSIQLYISNNKPIAKMYLYELGSKEMEIVKKKEKELPEHTSLYFLKKNFSF